MPELSSLEQTFQSYWTMLAADYPSPEREYKFHPTRKWRFDFCWVGQKVAVELDGATFSRGRHTRGSGFEKDCEKLNQATLLGWRVLRYTSGMLNNDPMLCIEQIKQLLKPE